MPLTTEQRRENMRKAREAKAAKTTEKQNIQPTPSSLSLFEQVTLVLMRNMDVKHSNGIDSILAQAKEITEKIKAAQ